MKKGLINIIILVLLITNVVLTATMAFAIIPAMNSVTSLVKKVAEGIDLQKEASSDSDIIGIDDMETYTFEQKITANLKNGSDNKTHYVSVKITLTLNKKDATQFASQGQQRAIVLSIKMALLEIVKKQVGEYPILLLDDVLSELDDTRKTKLLNLIDGKVQTFVTTTSIEGLHHSLIEKAKKIEIVNGSIKEES
jgi:recombinational DNA repair ATPase RecF